MSCLEKYAKKGKWLFLLYVLVMSRTRSRVNPGADSGLILGCCKILQKKLNIEMM